MKFQEILQSKVQDYINANLKSDLHSLLLKKSPFDNVSIQEIVQQIKGKKVAEKKFPFLLKNDIIFPPNLNLEQASSEATGGYKSHITNGKSMVDLTSGFGIDAYFVSKNFEKVTLIEQNKELLEIVKHNWQILGKKAEFISSTLEDFLDGNSMNYDLVYLDPARRDENKNKVFLLEDLSPNLLEIQTQLRQISDQILIKLSPLIDISYLISVLRNVAEIHIVAVKNDVKELLVFIKKNSDLDKVIIKCVNLETSEPDLEFYFEDLSMAKAEFLDAENFLYIPNNSVLKSGAFQLVAQKFNLNKLHQNSHFYTSNELITNFPGRTLSIEKMEAKSIEKGSKWNIISKNYPLSPEQIRKKYKLRDGGDKYLIFTESISGKIILKSV